MKKKRPGACCITDSCTKGWRRMFGTLTGIVLYMVVQVASSIEEFDCTKIWNNRYDTTIAWENSIHPTTRRSYLDPQTTISTASFFGSYLRWRRLQLMESEGGVKFITQNSPAGGRRERLLKQEKPSIPILDSTR